MDGTVNYIKQNKISDPIRAIKILMERAEATGADGPTKKKMVIDSYNSIVQSQPTQGEQGGATSATYQSGSPGQTTGGPYGSAIGDIIGTGVAGLLPGIPASVISLVIDAIVDVTKTGVQVNAQTGCWSAFTNLFKRKKTTA